MSECGKSKGRFHSLLAQRLELQRSLLHSRHAFAGIASFYAPGASAELLKIRRSCTFGHRTAEHIGRSAIALQNGMDHRLLAEGEIPVPDNPAGTGVKNAFLAGGSRPGHKCHRLHSRFAVRAKVVYASRLVTSVRPKIETRVLARR